MSFEVNGFLGKDVLKKAEQFEQEHRKLFEVCYEINRFAEKSKFDFVPLQESQLIESQLIATVLFVKFLEGSQAATILIRIGLEADASIVLRGVFETLISLILCVEDKAYHSEYVAYHDCSRLKLLKKAKDKADDDVVWATIKQGATKEYIDALEEKIKESGCEPKELSEKMKIKNLAERAGHTPLYESFYSVVSNDAHVRVCTLGRYISVDDKTGQIILDHRPFFDAAKMILTAVAEFTLLALKSMYKLFDKDKNDEIQCLHRKFLNIFKNEV